MRLMIASIRRNIAEAEAEEIEVDEANTRCHTEADDAKVILYHSQQ
jgi:hypothetical protein